MAFFPWWFLERRLLQGAPCSRMLSAGALRPVPEHNRNHYRELLFLSGRTATAFTPVSFACK